MSIEDAEALELEAGRCGLSLSELVRQRLSGTIITRTDEDTALSIERVGRMLKHLYPEERGWLTSEERQQLRSLLKELRETVAFLRLPSA